ncbi:hypothetical protein I4U23_005241 [Adineta vaga]|nr:hypothetical protein I4U23_005241 [Adineta vaga]
MTNSLINLHTDITSNLIDEVDDDINQTTVELLLFYTVPTSFKNPINIFPSRKESYYPLEILLIAAACEGNNQLIDICLKELRNIDIDIQLNENLRNLIQNNLLQTYSLNQYGGTALWFACYYGHLNIVHKLIKYGNADVNLPNDKYQSPLHAAICQKHYDIIRYLVEQANAIIDETRHLFIALQTRNNDIIDYLLNQGCDPNTRLIDESTDSTYFALHYAICQIPSDITIIQTIFNYNADPTIVNEDNETALHVAVRCENEKSVREILHHKFEHNQRNKTNFTPLMLALENKNKNIIDHFYELYPRQNYIDELMLLACHWTFYERFDIFGNVSIAFQYFEQALQLQELNINIISLYDFYLFRNECQTIDELIMIRNNSTLMYIQGFLVCERLLRQRNEIHLLIPEFFKFYDIYYNSKEYDYCLSLLIHIYPLILLTKDISFNYWNMTCLQLIVDLLGILITQDNIRYIDKIMQTFQWIFDYSKSTWYASRSCLYVTYLLANDQITKENKYQLGQWIKQAVHRKYGYESENIFIYVLKRCLYEIDDPFFQQVSPLNVIRLLIHCDVNVNTFAYIDGRLYVKASLLHLIASSNDIDLAQSIIELLIASGTHTDCLDDQRRLPEQCAKHTKIRQLLHSKRSMSLKCQCTHLIIAQGIQYESYLSETLKKFILLHQFSIS